MVWLGVHSLTPMLTVTGTVAKVVRMDDDDAIENGSSWFLPVQRHPVWAWPCRRQRLSRRLPSISFPWSWRWGSPSLVGYSVSS